GGQADLARLRLALDEDAFDPKRSDIVYLSRFGSAEDIARIARIHDDHRIGGLGSTLLTMVLSKPTKLAAEAILKLSKLNFEIIIEGTDGDLLSATIFSMPATRFRELAPAHIESLLANKNEKVRKITCLKILATWKARSINSFYDAYLTRSNRYYNVMFWLDLVNMLNLDALRKVAQRMLKEMSKNWRTRRTPIEEW
ncbi:hypothetical protein, partial [Erythrobacter sp.]|uniref:hypothetical protein n=1 Tax=Erythrobacter sp. TaxID=1042 RepID=UPI003C737010